MVQEHRLGARVKLTGQRSDVSDLLAAADVFAHPSQRDPFPLAVLEGLAAGLPVLAWADGGVREQVVHGETGFLVPTSDVNALTDAMSSLLGDASLRERMGQNAVRHVATHCNPARIAESFTSLMQRVARRG
jgi:glycosyltransferase involved in cell wall biosynthesis